MLTYPTLDKLHALRLQGMAQAFEEQLRTPGIEDLSAEERLGLLVDRELAQAPDPAPRDPTAQRQAAPWREPRRRRLPLPAWARQVLAHEACELTMATRAPQCPDHRAHRYREVLDGLCAGSKGLAHEGFSVLYVRTPRWLQELAIAKGDGRYGKLLAQLARTDLVVLDDFATAPFTEESRRDLLEFLEDRYEVRSTLITSQLAVEHWHEAIGHPALADAILDRLVHNAYKLNMKGESMRKRRATLTPTEPCEA